MLALPPEVARPRLVRESAQPRLGEQQAAVKAVDNMPYADRRALLLPLRSDPDRVVRSRRAANLAAIVRNVVAAGIDRILVAEAIETGSQLERIREALSGADIVVCRLTASLDTMEGRLRLREPGMHQNQFLVRSRVLHVRLEAAKLENFVIVNDGRSVTDVVREVLQRAAWMA